MIKKYLRGELVDCLNNLPVGTWNYNLYPNQLLASENERNQSNFSFSHNFCVNI